MEGHGFSRAERHLIPCRTRAGDSPRGLFFIPWRRFPAIHHHENCSGGGRHRHDLAGESVPNLGIGWWCSLTTGVRKGITARVTKSHEDPIFKAFSLCPFVSFVVIKQAPGRLHHHLESSLFGKFREKRDNSGRRFRFGLARPAGAFAGKAPWGKPSADVDRSFFFHAPPKSSSFKERFIDGQHYRGGGIRR